ncbi:hypothetical protein CK203_051670 [Vitis vinifera]|uniref:Uncharacterized protein n=1 Tax=Vitis vinifera TaxID=29760 RepID=A0A438D2T7_VITVI|nr:hypothetical protein CK203_111009 [Vitis vinifera]RVW79549.1 hypothetical protein CK203_051670 [Vitis vinifera]
MMRMIVIGIFQIRSHETAIGELSNLPTSRVFHLVKKKKAVVRPKDPVIDIKVRLIWCHCRLGGGSCDCLLELLYSVVSGIVDATKDSGNFSTFSAKEILKHWVPSRVMSFFLVWEVTGQKIFRINQLMKRGAWELETLCIDLGPYRKSTTGELLKEWRYSFGVGNVYQKNGNLFFRTTIQKATASEQKQLNSAKAKLQKLNSP